MPTAVLPQRETGMLLALRRSLWDILSNLKQWLMQASVRSWTPLLWQGLTTTTPWLVNQGPRAKQQARVAVMSVAR